MSDSQTLTYGRVVNKNQREYPDIKEFLKKKSFQAFYRAACGHQLNHPIFDISKKCTSASVDSPQKESLWGFTYAVAWSNFQKRELLRALEISFAKSPFKGIVKERPRALLVHFCQETILRNFFCFVLFKILMMIIE
jgi:hypothetical protein